MTMTTGRVATIAVHLDDATFDAELRREARAGLTAKRRWLAPTWLYDQRGCALFEAITELPEYYPTRTERGILAQRAGDIARLSGADTLVELGSGTSEKTHLLLDALAATGRLRRFVPFDVAEPTLRVAAEAIAAAYPGLEVDGRRRRLPPAPPGDPDGRPTALRVPRRHDRQLRASRAARLPHRAGGHDAPR